MVPCENGMAGIYPCQLVDLMAFVPNSSTGGGDANDLWGWTDPMTGHEYALLGKRDGTAFIDITDPINPIYVGRLPTHTNPSSWHDIKVYENHVFVVSEASGHGLQILDLNQLRDVTNPPVTFTETAHYAGFSDAHNLVINEETGFAYAVGSNCSGGLHMIDISDPVNPTSAGCFSADGYTHDAQCVIYQGPDANFQGSEICFNCNEDTLTIVDVSDKSNPAQLSRVTYAGVAYAHQAWLTPDHHYLLTDDELDEINNGHPTRTYLWDVSDLRNPLFLNFFEGSTNASDHNLYIRDNYVFQANYRAGLQILSTDNIASGTLNELAFFDIVPSDNNAGNSGAWSVYPYFESGNLIMSGISTGLFVLRPILCTAPAVPVNLAATATGDHLITLDWDDVSGTEISYDVYRAFGSCANHGSYSLIAENVTTSLFLDDSASGDVDYVYQITSLEETRMCTSTVSACATARTTGSCDAPPRFDGLVTVENSASETCRLALGWQPATALCGLTVTYSVYRSLQSTFIPSPANLIAANLSGTAYSDTNVESGILYYYIVRARHTANEVAETNLVRVAGRPTGPISDGAWQAGAETNDSPMEPQSTWSLSSARANSGSASYFSGSTDQLCSALLMPPMSLSAAFASQLSFSAWWNVEPQYDGGVVEISSDGGANWSILPLLEGYPDIFRSSSDACSFSTNDPCFTSSSIGWSAFTADLSAYNGGPPIQIRFRFSTDGSVTAEGFYVDDIVVEHTQVAAPCSSGCVTLSSQLPLWPGIDIRALILSVNCQQ